MMITKLIDSFRDGDADTRLVIFICIFVPIVVSCFAIMLGIEGCQKNVKLGHEIELKRLELQIERAKARNSEDLRNDKY